MLTDFSWVTIKIKLQVNVGTPEIECAGIMQGYQTALHSGQTPSATISD